MHSYTPGSRLPEDLSARRVTTDGSVILGVSGILGVAATGVLAPHLVLPAVTTVLAALYLASTIDRHWLLVQGLRSPSLLTISDEEARAVPDNQLPVYTVLLPVYNEPSIVHNLIAGVGRLEYPKDKLEILLLVEEDDIATRRAMATTELEAVRLILVPNSQPKTKPKACNYGMATPGLKGEMVTIYDAEDIPDPLQLRKAVVAFQQLPDNVGCLQARLGYFNEEQNLLTRWFSMEYDQWFGMTLPAVEAAGCVVPLGGTSNHMRTSVWRAIGGWDEFNVTEDADLGVRLARAGYRTRILDSVTLEEANSDVLNWIRQRSRWYKGYLQTMLVHLRHPAALWSQIGGKGILRLLNITGAVPLVAVMNLIFWSTMATWILGRPQFVEMAFPTLTYYVYLTMYLVGAPLSVYLGLIVLQHLGKPHLWWAAILVPLYWVLQSIAAMKAILQLVTRPHFWEKTVHGLSNQVPAGRVL
ncbi:glycosyltransferase [Mycolicibacterium gilvum]|uniref:Glycosyl transferase family protein n=1 Tax=Mycolicibacterium gilvum TaxID=1804 RepID=A0A378SHR9_9MYCO|nr:glycosyltransferase [Mycolicibacterium gilvum]MCV7054154.1 glycosyltransferase [Mycolicibacterium gilvum]STZ41384.1 glycosyl transferase family protein [Mycolicibacterium gilvum]